MRVRRSVVKHGGIHCYAGPQAESRGRKARCGKTAMPETCAAERGARGTAGRCMVPGACKGVFPKRLTGQRPANRKRDRERQQHDAERLLVPGGPPEEVPADTWGKA